MTSPIPFFRKRFSAVGTSARARQERAYLKSDLRLHGATSPTSGARAQTFAAAHLVLSHAELRAIVSELYATDWHEYRSVAIALLERYAALLRERDLPWLIGLVRGSNTWAHVDWLAADIIGGVVERYPIALKRLPGWATDRSFWVRRTALLAQLRALRRGGGDFALFARVASGRVEEKEFFIRKAIGWILREVSKTRPELVFAFLKAERERVSGLTLREGAKYLPAPMRTKLGLAAKPAWKRRDERDA